MGLDAKFDVSELVVRKEIPGLFGSVTKLMTTPITPKENTLRLYNGKTPMWAPFSMGEYNMIMIGCDPESQARSPQGGKDGYGVEWQFVPSAGGAMVKPGNPVIEDINDWKNCVTIPDPDTWDWEGFYNEKKDSLDPDLCTYVAAYGCLFERLIACMDYGNAVVALIDEDSKDAVHEFFTQVKEVHKKTYSNLKKWFDPEIVNFNDDWGTQKAQAFSNETYEEMILPYVKEIADHIHSMGMNFDLHCCGFAEPLVPLMIKAGIDSWGGQALNDKLKLKQLYGDQFIFTANIALPMDATEEQMDAVVEEFINGIGADNRCLVEVMGPPALREKIYVASRKNFDKLVAEGKAIL